jgi:hypothetical protein
MVLLSGVQFTFVQLTSIQHIQTKLLVLQFADEIVYEASKKEFCSYLTNIKTETRLFFRRFAHNQTTISHRQAAEHYFLKNTTSFWSKDVAFDF